MKYIYSLILAIAILSCSDDDTTSPEDKICIPEGLQESLIAYYPFSGGSIENTVDGSTPDNINNATPAEDRGGNANCAFSFSKADGSHLDDNNPKFLDDRRQYSVSLWYYHTVDNDGEYEGLIHRGQPNSRSNKLDIGIYDINKVTFSDFYSVWDTTDNNQLNKWYHVVATCDYDSKSMRLYQNGVLMESYASVTLEVINPSNGGHLYIGKDFTGRIDDIAIFDKVLTEDEIMKLYESDACCE